MVAHIADVTVAEALPVIPLVGTVARLVGTHRRRAHPLVPVQPLRHGRIRRHDRLGVDAVVIAPYVMHLPNGAALDVLDDLREDGRGVPVVAALRDDAGLLRRLQEKIRLLDRVGDRLLDVDVDAMLHREERGKRVLLLVRRDDHGVDAVRHLREEFMVVGKRGNLLVAASRIPLAETRTNGLQRAPVGIDERDDLHVLALRRKDIAHPKPAADQRHADAPSRRNRLRARRRTPDVEERQDASCGGPFQKRSSLHGVLLFHVIVP